MKKRLLLLLFVLLLFTGCGAKEPPTNNPIVTMSFEGFGEIKIELYPNDAYNTVANFVTLVQSGYYDNNEITRVQKGFVMQAGGAKELNYTIKGEFSSNGVPNNIKHTRGVISMARSNDPDSANGQFFIMLTDYPGLDGKYAAFGKVIEGMEVIEKIEKTNFRYSDTDYYFLEPSDYIKINKATVDTKGYKYNVEKIKR